MHLFWQPLACDRLKNEGGGHTAQKPDEQVAYVLLAKEGIIAFL
jgi:hypothetical protein